MLHTLYAADVIELESGWGQRHDGFLLAIDAQSFEKGARFIQEGGSSQEYSRAGDKKLVRVTPEMYERINNDTNKYIWIADKKETWYIEG